MLLLLIAVIAVASILAMFLFMKLKMKKMEQEHAAKSPKGERDDISEIDTETAVQEDPTSVVEEDGRAEGVSVQNEHATEAMETSHGIADV